ncbi:MAG: site-2 protease family protein [Gemmatimonadaceae bacterium]|nr:site-2 protease family protein [Gemmatimonadaceae bacterium]
MESLERFLLAAPMLLLAMVAHEYAHGWAARSQGDPTAEQLGRLTWNPLKHIDPFLTILLPAMLWFATSGSFVFGGAKPVPVDPRNYRQLKRGDIIVSMAGIVTNLALVVLLVVAIMAIGLLGRSVPAANESLALLQRMFVSGIVVNLVLAIFNLFPLPPLDGSHVMKWLLPPAWRAAYVRLGAFGLVILMLLMTVGRPILGAWMAPVSWLFEAAARVVAPFLLSSSLA